MKIQGLTADTVSITNKDITGNENTMIFNISVNHFMYAFENWQAGELIQSAFPMLNASEREFLISGTTPEIWDKLFKEPEE